MAKKKKKTKKKNSGNKFLLWLCLLAGVGGILFIYFTVKDKYTLKGIDVSHHNGNIDWPLVKSQGYHFAFIKATEGKTMVDENFVENWDNAKKAGIARGAYHYFLPSLSGKEQALQFLKTVKLQKGDLPPVLDLEVTNGKSADEISKGALEWMQTVEAATGTKPILYTLPRYAKDHLGKKLCGYPLWVVGLGILGPTTPPGWKSWLFWQYSHTGKIKGVKGTVDLNKFSGNVEELEALKMK